MKLLFLFSCFLVLYNVYSQIIWHLRKIPMKGPK